MLAAGRDPGARAATPGTDRAPRRSPAATALLLVLVGAVLGAGGSVLIFLLRAGDADPAPTTVSTGADEQAPETAEAAPPVESAPGSELEGQIELQAPVESEPESEPEPEPAPEPPPQPEPAPTPEPAPQPAPEPEPIPRAPAPSDQQMLQTLSGYVTALDAGDLWAAHALLSAEHQRRPEWSFDEFEDFWLGYLRRAELREILIADPVAAEITAVIDYHVGNGGHSRERVLLGFVLDDRGQPRIDRYVVEQADWLS